MFRRAVAVLATLAVLCGWLPLRASAQEDGGTTTSTTSTTEQPSDPVPALPGETTTTTTAPPQSTTTTSTPPPGEEPPPPDAHSEETVSEEVPLVDVEVPPAPEAAPDPLAPLLTQLSQLSLAQIQKEMKLAQTGQKSAAFQVAALSNEVARLEARLAELEQEKAAAVARLQKSRLTLRNRAVASYIGSPASQINQVLDATDFNDLTRRVELLGAVLEADRNRVDEYTKAKEDVGTELESVVSQLDASRSSLVVAQSVLEGADASLLAKQVMLAAVKAGEGIVGGGFVFPVGGPHSYSDTFGAPRMFGTQYAHLHEGTDIFAASGTPLLACERGVLVKIGSDVLGGTKLWLKGASGTYYYYAHLSAFAEGVVENKPVQAGEVVGFVGNTGNALTTPAHLHFEVHPQGGPAVNPYPLLKIVDDASKRLAGAVPAAPATTRPARPAA